MKQALRGNLNGQIGDGDLPVACGIVVTWVGQQGLQYEIPQ
jgi:hypothetical protein